MGSVLLLQLAQLLAADSRLFEPGGNFPCAQNEEQEIKNHQGVDPPLG